MTFSAHKIAAGYDTVDQVVTITAPARTLVDGLAPTPEAFEVLNTTVAEAATTLEGIAATQSAQWDALYEAREQLAQELGGGDPDRKGRTFTIDTAHAVTLTLDLLATLADYGLVHDTPAVRAAWQIMVGVSNDEARGEMIRRRGLNRGIAPAVVVAGVPA